MYNSPPPSKKKKKKPPSWVFMIYVLNSLLGPVPSIGLSFVSQDYYAIAITLKFMERLSFIFMLIPLIC